jgi:hypothetical protein
MRDFAAVLRYGNSRNPVGEMLRDVLLENRGSVNVRLEALHGQPALTDVRDHERRYPSIVVSYIAFRDFIPRKDDSVLVCRGDDATSYTLLAHAL